jgi:uncharacterized protein (TIGR00645 family)
MSEPKPSERSSHPPLELALERALFASRWLLAPIYLGLAASLVLLLINFAQKSISLVSHALTAGSDETIIGVLSLIDLSLMSNLLLMVIFAGYENFISEFELGKHEDKPEWMGHVGFGDLKLKLMTSIVAISAIHVLEDFMHVDQVSDRELIWTVGIHLCFIVSGLVLALMDRISGAAHK